jgi:hypothetical protein
LARLEQGEDNILTGFCKEGNESTDSIKGGEFLAQIISAIVSFKAPTEMLCFMEVITCN